MRNRGIGFTLLSGMTFIFVLSFLVIAIILLFQSYHGNTRDTVRISHFTNIGKNLEEIIIKGELLPLPTNHSEIDYRGSLLWTQGSFGETVDIGIGEGNNIPLDPLYGNQYTYSVNNFRSKYELSSVGEKYKGEGESIFSHLSNNKSSHRTILQGTYNGKFLKTNVGGLDYILALPSITTSTLKDTNITSILEKDNLVYDKQKNIPSSYDGLGYLMNGQLNYLNPYFIIFKGNLFELANKNAQLAFGVRLKRAYQGTTLSGDEFNNIISEEDFISKVVEYICNDTGGLGLAGKIKDCN